MFYIFWSLLIHSISWCTWATLVAQASTSTLIISSTKAKRPEKSRAGISITAAWVKKHHRAKVGPKVGASSFSWWFFTNPSGKIWKNVKLGNLLQPNRGEHKNKIFELPPPRVIYTTCFQDRWNFPHSHGICMVYHGAPYDQLLLIRSG